MSGFPIREGLRDGLAISTFVCGIASYNKTATENQKALDERRRDYARMEKLMAVSNSHLSELRKISEKPILSRLFISSKANDVKNKNKDKDSTK